MSVTVVGSIAFDAVKTPFGERERMLGGAATYFALAASFFDQVHVVGRVGEDFGDEDLAVVALRETDVDNIERVPGGKSFINASPNFTRHLLPSIVNRDNQCDSYARLDHTRIGSR